MLATLTTLGVGLAGTFLGQGFGPDPPPRVVTVVHEQPAQAPLWPWFVAAGVLGLVLVKD